MEEIDLLIHGRWMAPVEPDERVLENHAIAVHHGRIVAVLPSAECGQRYRPAVEHRLEGHLLIPGLVNAHTHAAMTLFRGLADDLPLMEWLQRHIWPAEQRWVETEMVRDGSRLACAEMLRGGITCFNDMYFWPEVTAHCAEESGMRSVVGMIVLDFPTRWAGSLEEYFDKGLEIHDRFSSSPLVEVIFAPHAPYTVSNAPLERVATLAAELEVPIHIHLHETADEIRQSLEQHGVRPLERLHRLGLLSPSLVAVHMTQLTEEEIERVAESGLHVVHCPESNLKLASGFCPVARLQAAGVPVALGTDGAASNNDLDLLGEMRSAALLAKAVAGDAAALPAHRALRMATLEGARALGLEERIGSLLPGKEADVVAVRLDEPDTLPVYHPVSQLVYAAARHQVTDVWVGGRHLVAGGELTTLDQGQLAEAAHRWGRRIAASDAAGSAT
ncbi:MAG TPA: TRZ/ATZ family hydrolase [Thiotrichales bacterium]|nr:TRZ/ATZ family hydrolase [Thiotrichales bacterium]